VIAQWLKSEGESVAADEPLVEVETDKITVEVPAPAAGVLSRRGASEGDTVNVGDVIGEIDDANQARTSKASGLVRPNDAPRTQPASAASPVSDTPAAPAGRDNDAPAMPSARAEAQRRGIDLTLVEGSGRGGRILKEDVMKVAGIAPDKTASAAPTATKPDVSRPTESRQTRKSMSPLRQRVAQRLVEAQQNAAILTTFNELDMSGVVELRTRWKDRFVEQHGVKLGFMSFFVKAAVDALKAFPAVNAEIDGTDVIYKHYYDIGVAVGSGKGLVVPVIRDADRLGFAEVEQRIGEFANRAKNNKLTLDDLTGGTFTISNGGVYGSMMSTPILNPPQTGILGLHNIVPRPMAVDGKVEIRPMMYLALSYDHRLIDGREAVQFLLRIKNLLEQPERLFLGV
jgi:2-oxoglutarate dehydrogenase E2 component (dihydrolipoamide succinyltransferase)